MELDQDMIEKLNLLGLKTSTESESRTVALLRIMLQLQSETERPMEFSEIYDAILREEEELSKTWVHRLLKGLTDVGLVRTEGERTYRKRFIADATTLTRGLEKLKAQRRGEVQEQIQELQDETQRLQEIDCGLLAQQMVATITGREQVPRARFIQGVEELDRVLRYAITDDAGEGDIIRATVMRGRAFLEGGIERTYKFVRAAERGAEIRYMFRPEFFAMGDEVTEKMGQESIAGFIQEMIRMRTEDIPFFIRVSRQPRTYNQVALNADKIALIITEEPMNATLVTKDFNPDLVRSAIENFDSAWNRAFSITDLSTEQLEMVVKKGPSFILDVLSRLDNDRSG
ncbi:hypothetical protein EU545_04835 [Candidatus Thorarchaeota archaeon]|nr:MAG: hypothetical protein EU545_04835 [Candidatus Thorarchaeota archaeon]